MKYFLQKLFRGYSDRDLWNLDVTIAKFIYPRLHRFIEKDVKGWHPPEMSEAEWNKVLNTMCRAFKIITEWPNIIMEVDDVEPYAKEIQKGLELFAKYYLYLWT